MAFVHDHKNLIYISGAFFSKLITLILQSKRYKLSLRIKKSVIFPHKHQAKNKPHLLFGIFPWQRY